MTTAIVNHGAFIDGDSFTAGAGSNRRLVLGAFYRKDTGTPLPAPTFGGVSMTLLSDSGWINSGDDRAHFYCLKESEIPSGAQSISWNLSGGTTLITPRGYAWVVSGCDQTTALDDDDYALATGTNTVTSGSMTNSAEACFLGMIRNSAGDDFGTFPSGWIEDGNQTGIGRIAAFSNDNASAATATYTFVGVDPTTVVSLILAIKAAGGSSPVLTATQHPQINRRKTGRFF